MSVFKPIYAGFKSRLKEEFGDGINIITEPMRDKEMKGLPAIFIECDDFGQARDLGTGEIEIPTSWEITVLLDTNQKDAKIVARDASARIALIFNDKHITDKCHETKHVASSDANFDFNVPRYEAWVTEFDITVRVGRDDWKRESFYPELFEGGSSE